jgi:protocatechuate 3,4-dioxygenase beta subunit
VVDIWQCDNEGHYSDFKEENTMNHTWLREFQTKDKNGECRFKSIFPGWYTGRIIQLHVKINNNNTSVLTTNCFLPEENEVPPCLFTTHQIVITTIFDYDETR